MVPSIEDGAHRAHRQSRAEERPRGRGRLEAARPSARPGGRRAFRLLLTTAGAGHGELAARELGPEVGCVVALGGDGLVSEVANGLMAAPPRIRPVLAVIPVGSGNDYADTLGMAYSVPTAVDRDSALSNGAGRRGAGQRALLRRDALVRLGRRYRALTPWTVASSRGAPAPCLYLGECRRSAVPPLGRSVSARDGCPGGGAGMRPSSGRDVPISSPCRSGPPMAATSASHPRRASTTGCSNLLGHAGALPTRARWRCCCALGAASTRQATTSTSGAAPRSLLDFDDGPPAQIDGEPLFGTHFLVDCVPDALTVVVGQR